MKIASLLCSLFVLSNLALAQPPNRPGGGGNTPAAPAATPSTAGSAAPARIDPPVVVKQSVTVGGKKLDYTVTTGYMPLSNATTGEVEARMFYMAYTLDNAPAGRPLMFSFNGGPGSSSVWLHLGALGPKRVKMLDDGMMPPPPYEMEDNQQTWFTETDLVFIDPIGTGYSRATRPELAAKYFGVQGDIESVGDFIRMYLGRNERWMSPLYVVGESYGTTRAAGLSDHLFGRGIALNGILLVSAVLNFQTIRFANNNDMPLMFILPSYTATAWYHKRLSPALQSKTIEQVTQEARQFVANEYGPALLRIDSLTERERDALATRFSTLTGLSKSFIEQNNFRVELGEFNKELLRSERRSTGRLDSRFKGIDRDAGGNNTDSDPSMNAIRPPYTAAFNQYVRNELGFKTDTEYYILGGGITAPWNYNVTNQYADTSVSMKDAMAKNPYMKVWLAQGYYDMATPFYAAEYTISALNLDPTLKKNISWSYYESGHMMYIETRSLKKLKDDLVVFLNQSRKK